MVRRHSAVRRRGLTAYRMAELLNGVIRYPLRYYDGYGDMLADQGHDSLTANYISDAMREDWEENRDALMAFWRSGGRASEDFGLPAMPLWLRVGGSRGTLPWAAREFDRGRLARSTCRADQGTRGKP